MTLIITKFHEEKLCCVSANHAKVATKILKPTPQRKSRIQLVTQCVTGLTKMRNNKM